MKRKRKRNAAKTYFDIAVIATVSSGKSTIMNALLQQDFLPVSNEPTTAKVFTITDNDQQDYFTVRCRSKQGKIIRGNPVVSGDLLRTYNRDPLIQYIDLEGNIPSICGGKIKVRWIDTPGPNNSSDSSHRELMKSVLDRKTLSLVMFVLDATKPQEESEALLLEEVRNSLKTHPGRDIIFVLNKLDSLNEEDGESLEKAIENTRAYLKRIGLPQEPIFPLNAKMAVLLHKLAQNRSLTKKEAHELSSFAFNQNYSDYADLSDACQNILKQERRKSVSCESAIAAGLYQSGITALQAAIQEQCDKRQ